MAETITITIDKKIYKRLVRVKLNQDLRTFNDVLSYLLKKKNCSLEAKGGNDGKTN